MGKYRVYRVTLNGKNEETMEKTTFVGNEKVIKGILDELAFSKFHSYIMLSE